MKRKTVFSMMLAVLVTLSACAPANTVQKESTSSQPVPTVTEDSLPAANLADMFADSDLEIGYDEETSTKITLSGDKAASDSDAVQISGSVVTIMEEGTYILCGTLNDGMIVVNAEDTDKVRLVLNGVDITNSTSAAIYIPQADKVFITTAAGTENTLMNGGEYVPIDDNNIDAVVFSKSDLILNGAGTLTIEAAAGHGVVSKDDLLLTSGTYYITAASHGLSGKDSVRIANGTYAITAGKDGIHAENTEDTSAGFLYIAGGTFTIAADGDGMHAGAYLQIEDGTFTITTGAGSSSAVMTIDSMDPNQKGGFQDQTADTLTADVSISQKGIKAAGTVEITGGTFTADTVDDAIHSNSDVLITDGVYELKSGDDAIHADGAIDIQNGDFTISYCYEGIEGLSVTIEEGSYDINAVDDGINAGGGADSSGFGGGRPDHEKFSSSPDSFITINGGNFVIVSTGDCIDSNGALTINSGVLNLTCNGRGNTALDCDGTYTDNGGEVTTNDGSENNPGHMGGMGGQNNKRDHGGVGDPNHRGNFEEKGQDPGR